MCVERESIFYFLKQEKNFNMPLLFSLLIPLQPKCGDNHEILFPGFGTYFTVIIRFLTISFTDLVACYDFLFLRLFVFWIIFLFFVSIPPTNKFWYVFLSLSSNCLFSILIFSLTCVLFRIGLFNLQTFWYYVIIFLNWFLVSFQYG